MLLPATDAPTIVDAAPARPTTRPCRVLLVDDEAIVRSQLRRSLELRGYAVVEATDGRTALATLLPASAVPVVEGVDVVVLDMTMPDLDGAEVLRRLRAAGSRVPVVISSGYLDVAVERRLPRGAFQGFLAKPYSATELVSAIERARPPATTTKADATEGRRIIVSSLWRARPRQRRRRRPDHLPHGIYRKHKVLRTGRLQPEVESAGHRLPEHRTDFRSRATVGAHCVRWQTKTLVDWQRRHGLAPLFAPPRRDHAHVCVSLQQRITCGLDVRVRQEHIPAAQIHNGDLATTKGADNEYWTSVEKGAPRNHLRDVGDGEYGARWMP